MPRFNPLNACGYHIRDAGSTAVQEVALTIARPSATSSAPVTAGIEPDRARAARLVLLGRPQRLPRGGRQAARRPPAVGADDARAAGVQGPAVVADAGPLPDRRRLADRPAADQQRRAHRDPGARRGVRRHPVAAHQLARRGVRDPLRGGDQDRRPDPADHPPRERRRRRRRPARRLVLRRVADHPDRGGGRRADRAGSTTWAG